MLVTDIKASLNPVIYIVDPDSKQRAGLMTLFERTGYEAVSYPSAEAFLETELNPARIGCVVSEMKLPGVGGLELLTALRERNSRLPMIILTGDPDVSQAVTALQKKVSDYMVKPVIERDLIKRIKVALRSVRDSQRTVQDSRHN
jgi:FixJ family two-component response regulator